ncbi:hypothetical protein BGZ76_009872 [Entomortierella beljakovae]|nr:hypothetical protein BGZ76_009872 [Entomortierella beljakovae]
MSDKELLAQIAQIAASHQYPFNNARGGYNGRGRGRGRGAPITPPPGPFNRKLTLTNASPTSTPAVVPKVPSLPMPAKVFPQSTTSFARPQVSSRHLSLVNKTATGTTTAVPASLQPTTNKAPPVKPINFSIRAKGTPLISSMKPSSAADPQHQKQHWIQSKGKNMSMMNPESYKKTMEAKLKSIQSSKEKKKKLHEAQAKLASDRLKGIVTVGGKQYSKSLDGRKLVMRDTSQDTIVINGVAFEMDPRGNKLVRKSTTAAIPQAASSTADTKNQTPKQFSMEGVVYVRTTSGNLVRASLTKKYLLHKRSHLAICKKFLRGNCPNNANSCHLSHTPSPNTTPACLHFQRAACSNDNCLYQHIRFNPRAPICRPFVTEGWCETGGNCKDRHVWICPDFGTPAGCKKKCGLAHIENKRSTDELDNDKKRQGDNNLENSKRRRVDSFHSVRPSGRYMDNSSTQRLEQGQGQGQINDNVTKKLQHDENFVPFDFDDNDEIPFVDQDENEVMGDFEADQEMDVEKEEEEDISSDELDDDIEEESEYDEEDEVVETSESEIDSDSEAVDDRHEDELERFYAEQDREYDDY